MDMMQDLVEDGAVIGADFRQAGRGRAAAFQYLLHSLIKNLDPCRARSRHWNHRNAQSCLQHLRLDSDAFLPGDIHHVQDDGKGCGKGNELGNQIQAAFQARRIHHCNDQVRLLAQDIFACDNFFGRICRQAIGTGQVDNPVYLSIDREATLFSLHRLPGPISHMLVQTR